MNRRGFLGMLGAAIASATLDPERALWEPGKRLISIPAPKTYVPSLNIGDMITLDGYYALNPATFEPTGFLQRFMVTGVSESGDATLIPRPGYDKPPYGSNRLIIA